MFLGTTYSPTVPVGVAPQVTNFDQCLHIAMVIWKSTDVFGGISRLRGRGVEKRGMYWGNFPWKNLSWGKKSFMKGEQDFLALFKKKTMKK